jgi:hypothetical protein
MTPVSSCGGKIEYVTVEGSAVASSVCLEELDLDTVKRSVWSYRRRDGEGEGCIFEEYRVGAECYCRVTS